MTFKLNAPEPRPVFIDLSFGSSELTPGNAIELVLCLLQRKHEKIDHGDCISFWQHADPLALVGPDENGDLTAHTVVSWPEGKDLNSLDDFVISHFRGVPWSLRHRLVGPSNDEWDDYVEVFRKHGYECTRDPNWRRD